MHGLDELKIRIISIQSVVKKKHEYPWIVHEFIHEYLQKGINDKFVSINDNSVRIYQQQRIKTDYTDCTN